MPPSSSTVFVSGATGYISQHICKDLLAAGYTVVGSVRSADKGDNLKRLLQSDKFYHEVVPDIVTEGAFNESLQKHPDIDFFLHAASPVTFKVKDIEKDLMLPAIQGTTNALNAIKKYGKNIKHVVITSSYAAMLDIPKQTDPSHTVNESTWCPLSYKASQSDPFSGYVGSKAIAEKLAWDFVESKDVSFSLNTVNPVYVLGPQAFDENVHSALNYSAEIIHGVFNLKVGDEIPGIYGGYCDVRDVSRAHIASIERASLMKGQRLLMCNATFTSQDILDILNETFADLRGVLPLGKPGLGKETLAQCCAIDSTKTKAILGFEQVPFKTSVIDSVNQLRRVSAST